MKTTGAMLLCLILLVVGVAADSDHERARRAHEAGEIVSLRTILEDVEANFRGQVIEAELERKGGRRIYEVELLTPDGNVIELGYDARTGRFLGAEGKGVDAARKVR